MFVLWTSQNYEPEGGHVPIIFSWMLLVITIIDVMFAVVQLFFLHGMKLVIHEMRPWQAWLLVVGTPAFGLVLVGMSLFDAEQRISWFVPALVWLIIVAVFQYGATIPIVEQWEAWRIEEQKRTAIRPIR